jgi:hypothetical protein
MPDMPLWIAKGNILMAVDEANPNTLIDIRQALERGDQVYDVAATHLPLSGEAVQHLQDDWFSDTGWFPARRLADGRTTSDVSQVIREAFIHAINVVNPGSQGPVRPLDCYWVCVRGDEDLTTSVAVSGRPGSVVVIIKTPVPTRAPTRTGTTSMDEPFRMVFEGREPYHPQYREI